MNDQAAAPPLMRSTADQVAILTLNRPRQYNALSGALLDALHAELDDLARDREVRAVLVTGTGAPSARATT
jgi:enoyl-CoA hydratase/carnithine racemase